MTIINREWLLIEDGNQSEKLDDFNQFYFILFYFFFDYLSGSSINTFLLLWLTQLI